MRRKFYLDDFGLIRTDYEDGYLHHGLMLYRNDDEIDVTLSRLLDLMGKLISTMNIQLYIMD